MALVINGDGPITGVSNVTFTGAGTISGLASAAIAASKIGTGAVLQVVTGTTSTSVSSSSTTLVDTGLTVNITPSSLSSKILVLYSCNINGAANDAIFGRTVLLRNSTIIRDNPAHFLVSVQYPTNINNMDSCCHLDSPSTTSQITYKVQFARRSFAGAYGGTINANYYTDTPVNQSSITVMEIAG